VRDEDHEPGRDEPSGALLHEPEAAPESDQPVEHGENDVRRLLLARIREKVRRADDR
jgi:hypothetical protein